MCLVSSTVKAWPVALSDVKSVWAGGEGRGVFLLSGSVPIPVLPCKVCDA